MNLKPIVPFEPVVCDKGPSGSEWIAQIKWDGVRMLTYRDGRETRLINRRGNDRTAQYPEFLDPADYCTASSFILDGEMISLDESKPSFHEIMRRDSLRKAASIEAAVHTVPVVYMLFDIVYCDGEWVTDRPLAERQRLLERVAISGPRVQLTGNFPDGDALYAVMKEKGMEGIVYKDLGSLYAPDGKDGRWRKRKITHDLYAAVGGATYRDGIVNALLLGLFAPDGTFRYIGHAGTGKLSHAEWRELTAVAEGLKTRSRPFADEPERSRDAVWLTPKLVAKVQFLEWTRGGTMRQPSIQAISIGADAVAECTTMQLSP